MQAAWIVCEWMSERHQLLLPALWQRQHLTQQQLSAVPRRCTAPAAGLPAAVHAEPAAHAAGARRAAARSNWQWHAAGWLQQPAVPAEEEALKATHHCIITIPISDDTDRHCRR